MVEWRKRGRGDRKRGGRGFVGECLKVDREASLIDVFQGDPAVHSKLTM